MPGRQRGARGGSGQPDPPLRSVRKNSEADRSFIKDNRTEFRIEDGRLVYTGQSLDFGHPFQLPPEEHRCTWKKIIRDDTGAAVLEDGITGTEPLGWRCPNWGIRLANSRTLHLCIEHVPRGAAGVQAAIKQLLLSAGLALTQKMIDNGLSPATSVKDQTAITTQTLDRIGVRGGVEVSADVKGWELVLKDMLEPGGGNDGGDDAGAEGSE